MSNTKRLAINIVLTIFTYGLCYGQETIRIYHGQGGNTKIISAASGKKILSSTKHTIVIEEGEEVNVEIINSNPALYNYKFNKTDLKIEEENLPDISPLVKSLSSILLATSTPTIGSRPAVAAQPAVAAAVGVPAVAAVAAQPAVPAPKELNILIAKINTLKSKLTDIQAAIASSDNPESTQQALNLSNGAGFRKAMADIRLIFLLNNLNDTEKDLKAQLQKVVSNKEFPDNDSDGKPEDTYEEAYKIYIESLGKVIKDLNDNFVSSSIKDNISFSLNTEQKPQEIEISIESKKENSIRDLGKVITIKIIPYKKTILEVVPFYSMLYSPSRIKFEVENSIIIRKAENDFTFRPGAMLVINAFRFGKLKDLSVGPGLGFSVQPKTNVLENLNLGVLLSYKETIRLGFGWGMQQYPIDLKNGAKEGSALPPNISRIEDVTQYSGKPAFMINFSLFGLKIL